MQTNFMWDESISVDDVPFELTEKNLDCHRIQRGDVFNVWIPNEEKDGGSITYKLVVTEVKYQFNQTWGDPDDVRQYVSLSPVLEEDDKQRSEAER